MVFLDCQGNPKSAVEYKKLKKHKGMDWIHRLDVRTKPWGSPGDNQERTFFSFYVGTNKVSKNLKELRDTNRITQWLKLGNCTMHQTRLMESCSVPIQAVLNKDTNHLHRDSFADRCETHVQQYTPDNKIIPLNVVNMLMAGSRVPVVLAGEKDAKTVSRILQEHPIPHLETVPYRYKRTNKEELETRMRQNDMIVSQTRAFKIENVDEEDLESFRDDMFASDACTMIVDVAEAGHFKTSGVVYVQHIQSHKDLVLDCVQQVLQKYSSALLVERVKQDSQSAQKSSKFTEEEIPASRFSSLLDQSVGTASKRPLRNVVEKVPPAVSTKAKSWADVLRQELSSDDDLTDSDSEKSTHSNDDNTQGGNTIKSQRELELEKENEDLKAALTTSEQEKADMKSSIQNLEQALAEQTQKMDAQVESKVNLAIETQVKQAISQQQKAMQQQQQEMDKQKQEMNELREMLRQLMSKSSQQPTPSANKPVTQTTDQRKLQNPDRTPQSSVKKRTKYRTPEDVVNDTTKRPSTTTIIAGQPYPGYPGMPQQPPHQLVSSPVVFTQTPTTAATGPTRDVAESDGKKVT